MARNISSARKPVRMSARSRFVHSLRRRGSDSELRAASRAATKSAGSAFGSVLATFGRPTNAIGPIEENKAVVGRWFTEFWGENFNPDVIGELAAPDIRFEYSLHTPCRGRDEVRAFATKFRAAFPDLAFGATADLIAEGDYVVGQWIGGGTPTGEAFDDMPIGALPAGTNKTMRFTGTSVLKVVDGLIVEEIGLDDGVTVLQQLDLIKPA